MIFKTIFFIRWGFMTEHKADDFRHCTLRSLREDIELGSPPSAFRTNDSESIDALLKELLGYKKHTQENNAAAAK